MHSRPMYQRTMLPKTSWRLVQRPHHQWRSKDIRQISHWVIQRPPDYSQKTEMAHIKIVRTSQNSPARHGSRRQKERRAEEELGRQHRGVDKPEDEHHPHKGRRQTEVESIGGALTVNMTMGWESGIRYLNFCYYRYFMACHHCDTKPHLPDAVLVRRKTSEWIRISQWKAKRKKL